jgi:hypothetical protein
MSLNTIEKENAQASPHRVGDSRSDERRAVPARTKVAARGLGDPAAAAQRTRAERRTRCATTALERPGAAEPAEAEPTAVDPELAARIAQDYAVMSGEETCRDRDAYAGPGVMPAADPLSPVHNLPDRLALSVEDRVRMGARELHASAPADPALWIFSDGAGFCPNDGMWIDLTRRKQLRRILAALLVAKALTIEEVLRAGWPGEFVSPQAGAARVHVAISSLRRLGLGTTLAHGSAGYSLDRRRVVVIQVEAPTYVGTALGS